MFYAIRLGFGFEGHGNAILVAKGATVKEAEDNAREALQSEFGGLWASKIRDTYIGSRTWLRRNFPSQRGCRGVDAVIDGDDY